MHGLGPGPSPATPGVLHRQRPSEREMDILLGGDDELMRHWVNTHNKHLKFCPGAYLTSEYHMDKILGYLDAMVEH